MNLNQPPQSLGSLSHHHHAACMRRAGQLLCCWIVWICHSEGKLHVTSSHGIAWHRMTSHVNQKYSGRACLCGGGSLKYSWNRKQESWETAKKRWKRTLCSHDSRMGASSRTTLLRVSESVIMMPKGTESVGANSSSHWKGHLHHCSRFSSVLKE